VAWLLTESTVRRSSMANGTGPVTERLKTSHC
jgi:hypothetical protein